MAETPLTPGTPGNPDPAAAENAAPDVTPLEDAPLEERGAEEPVVEGWSGTPVAVSAEEAIARPGPSTPATDVAVGATEGASDGPIEISIQPPTDTPEAAPEPSVEPPLAAAETACETVAETVAEAVALPTEPTIAITLDIPPAPGSTPAEGGEFDLLIEKLRSWFDEADLAGQWQKLRGPLKGVALLLVAVLALRLYARVVGTLDAIPVVSGLLELTGLVYLIWFCSTRLVRTSERERVLADWKRRWQDFSGRA